MLKFFLIIFCTFCFTLFLSPAIAIEKAPVTQKGNPDVMSKLFADDEILELEILGPISSIRRDRGEKRKYHPAKLVYFDKIKNKKVSLKIELRTRGFFRKNPRNCNFPPLKVKFSKPELKGTIFKKQKSLKLVTHCQSRKKIYEQYLFGEYLVYKIYNIFTKKSLAVRLAHISYIDTDKNKKLFSKYAFFIENEKKMAKRNGLKRFKFQQGKNYTLNLKQRSLLAVFQFMVGNTDWAKFGDHNIIFLTPGSNRSLVSVPYDFDFCGIVNAHYAGPAKESGIYTFQQRVFQGYCRSEHEFNQIFDLFRANREKIISLYEEFPLLSKRYKKYVNKYLDKSYKIINNPKLVKKYFLKGCRKTGKGSQPN